MRICLEFLGIPPNYTYYSSECALLRSVPQNTLLSRVVAKLNIDDSRRHPTTPSLWCWLEFPHNLIHFYITKQPLQHVIHLKTQQSI